MKIFLRSVVCILLYAGCVSQAVSQEPAAGSLRIIRKVLFIGDSITLNPPRETLGWKGNWGMAASASEKDFVHLFYAKLCAAQPEPKPELVISGRDVAVAGRLDQTLTNLDRLKAVGADLIVIQLGENEGEKDFGTFEELYGRLVIGLKGDQKPIILCTGVWNRHEEPARQDGMIRAVCLRQRSHFVPIAPIPPGCDAGSEGRFTNWGVNWHPGDKGMQHYADALWKVAAPLLGIKIKPDVPPLAPAQSEIEGFEYETNADKMILDVEQLKSTWNIKLEGFDEPIQIRLNTTEAREGKKCLELILPPTPTNGEKTARLILDVFPKVAPKKIKQTRFWIFAERTKGISQSALYYTSLDLKNSFCRYGFLKRDHDGWQKVYVDKTTFREEGLPSWDDVRQMRISLWFDANEPGRRILLDEIDWDNEMERHVNLNKDWYD